MIARLFPPGSDIFAAGPGVALVNPVDARTGAQGKGLALAFARRYRAAALAYRQHARLGAMSPGSLWFIRGDSRWIIFAATKDHWRNPSRIEWVQECLNNLEREVAQRCIRSVAIPALGCGFGGLTWEEVRPLLLAAGGRMAMAGVEVQVFMPHEGRDGTMTTRIGVATIVRRPDGLALFGLRRGSHGAGTWSIPGGALEDGELPLECARRELEEETGIKPARMDELGCATFTTFPESDGGAAWVTLYALAEVPPWTRAELREPEKCVEWRWCPGFPGPLFAPLRRLVEASVDLWGVRA